MPRRNPGSKATPSRYASLSGKPLRLQCLTFNVFIGEHPLWLALRRGAIQEGYVNTLPVFATCIMTLSVVLYQCALNRDLSLFDAGDDTEVGEKGLTLR